MHGIAMAARSITRKIAIVCACLLLPVPGLFAQSPLERRFDEDSFQDSLALDISRPLFADEAEAREAFARGGKWSLKLSSDVAFDSNPFREPNAREDWRWDYGTSLGYEWWTSEETGIVVSPAASMSGQRYDSFEQLDGDMLGAGVTITLKKLPFSPEFSYAGGWGFESGFGENNYTEHVLTFAAGKKVPLQKKPNGGPNDQGVILSWRLAGGYQFTDPSLLDRSFVNGTLGLNVPLTKVLTLTFSSSLAYRSYTDFQPEDRNTVLASASAGLTWAITDSVTLSGKATYTRADDRISAKDYDQVLAVVLLSWTPDISGFLGLPPKPGYRTKREAQYSK